MSSEKNYATTSTKNIKNMSDNNTKLFICVTIRSFKKIRYAFEKFRHIYLIGDEAHHLCDVSGKKAHSPLKFLEENLLMGSIKKMLFGTATPKIGNYESVRQDCIVMNNPKYFGEKIHLSRPVNLRRLRQENFLCPYQVIMGEVNEKDLQKVNGALFKEDYLNYQASTKLLKKLILANGNHKKILMYTTGIGDTTKNLGVRDLFKIIKKEFAELKKTIKISLTLN